jgi:hypothetical protein
MTRRPKTPRETEEELLLAADHRCSKCHGMEHDVQVHHIDGKPTNNSDANLIVLCLNCHSEVERKGGLGKKFSAGELWKCRTNWEREVERRREQMLNFDVALAVFEIKKLSNRLQAIPESKSRLDEATEILWNMCNWCELADRKVRHEAASAVYSSTARIMRDRASAKFVEALCAVLDYCLPNFSHVFPQSEPIDPADLELIEHVASAAGNLANSACKYASESDVSDAPIRLLGNILRLVLMNDLTKLQEELEFDLNECIRVARHPQHIPMLEEELRHAYEHAAFYKEACTRRNL